MDQRAVELAMAEADAKKAVNMAQRDYNQALVRLVISTVSDFSVSVKCYYYLCFQ